MSASWSPSPLIPPFRFGTIEQDVYRGAYPKQRNMRYLKRLKLKTILSLIPDAPDATFQAFCQEQGIQSIHLPVDKVKDNVPLTYNRAVEAVQIMIDQDNLPIYVHCLDGASVTGLAVCCLRKLQTWNISSAMGEFLRYLRGGVISSEESVFVEKFASEIVISKPIPPWLWEGQVTFKKHPTLKLKFTIPPPTSSPSMSSTQSTLVSFPSQHNEAGSNQNISNSGGGNNNSSTGSVAGSLSNNTSGSSSTNSLSNLYSSAQGSVSGGSGSSGLMNHVARSSVKSSRDRPSNNKSMIRTDLGGARSTSLATPTTASMARAKRTMVGQGSTSSHEMANFDASSGGSGLGVRIVGGISAVSGNSGTGLGLDATSTGGDASVPNTGGSSAVISVMGQHPLGVEQDIGKDVQYGSNSKAEDMGDNSAQERSQVMVKNSPAPPSAQAAVPEAADEYYEVSMTLKALALEGADF